MAEHKRDRDHTGVSQPRDRANTEGPQQSDREEQKRERVEGSESEEERQKPHPERRPGQLPLPD
jgi:hypothetical protein